MGVATTLIDAVRDVGASPRRKRLYLTTTDDTVAALRFIRRGTSCWWRCIVMRLSKRAN